MKIIKRSISTIATAVCVVAFGTGACSEAEFGELSDAPVEVAVSTTIRSSREALTTELSFATSLRTMFTGDASCMSVIDDGANTVKMAPCGAATKGRGQTWEIAPAQVTGSYNLSTTVDGARRCLDIANDGQNDRVVLAQCAYLSGQLWQLDETQHVNYVRMRTQFTGIDRCLDIRNDGQNAEIRMAPCGDYSGQYWKIEHPASSTSAPVSCHVGGCSGQLCLAGGQERETSCDYRPEYACYRGATCGVQANGACGWTNSAALTACLTSQRASTSPSVAASPASTPVASTPAPIPPARPAFSASEELTIALGSPIPTGWVVVRAYGDSSIIRNLNNAPSGTEQSIVLGSPIPTGWVVVRAYGDSSIIKNLNRPSSPVGGKVPSFS